MNLQELITAMQATASEAAKPLPVTVAGWGTVHIRALTVAEVDVMDEPELKKDADGKVIKDKIRLARSAARLICDEHGNRLFDADNEEHIALLAAQPWILLSDIFDASKKLLNGAGEKNSLSAKNS